MVRRVGPPALYDGTPSADIPTSLAERERLRQSFLRLRVTGDLVNCPRNPGAPQPGAGTDRPRAGAFEAVRTAKGYG